MRDKLKINKQLLLWFWLQYFLMEFIIICCFLRCQVEESVEPLFSEWETQDSGYVEAEQQLENSCTSLCSSSHTETGSITQSLTSTKELQHTYSRTESVRSRASTELSITYRESELLGLPDSEASL